MSKLLTTILIVSLAVVSACGKKSVSSSTTNNPDIKVELLFTHNGCRVYRFHDGGTRYFTNCDSTTWEESYQCGKSVCTREESIHTVRTK